MPTSKSPFRQWELLETMKSCYLQWTFEITSINSSLTTQLRTTRCQRSFLDLELWVPNSARSLCCSKSRSQWIMASRAFESTNRSNPYALPTNRALKCLWQRWMNQPWPLKYTQNWCISWCRRIWCWMDQEFDTQMKRSLGTCCKRLLEETFLEQQFEFWPS